MTQGYVREMIEVNQQELRKISEAPQTVRVGASGNVDSRANQYEREGYSGVMYYAKTSNQMRAEDKRLEHAHVHNRHQYSNAAAAPGYVYAIKGRRYGEHLMSWLSVLYIYKYYTHIHECCTVYGSACSSFELATCRLIGDQTEGERAGIPFWVSGNCG